MGNAQIPTFTSAGKQSIDRFFPEGHTSIFFFEDSNSEVFYERLIKRLFPDVERFRVVSLHGKGEVLKKANTPRIAGLIYVFIVDKDFDELLGRELHHSDVFYLRRYSLENYLLNVTALIRVLVEEFPHQISEQAAHMNCGDSATYYQRLIARYLDITRYFIVAQRYRVPIENTKMPAAMALEGSEEIDPVPTDEWLASYRSRFLERAQTQAKSEWLSDPDILDSELLNAFTPAATATLQPVPHEHQIPGKHLLFCLVQFVSFRVLAAFRDLPTYKLYIRLLNHVDLSSLHDVRDAILQVHPSLAKQG